VRALLALALLCACSEGKSHCIPGASSACACSDGSSGAQVCRADGTFDICVCSVVVGPDFSNLADLGRPVLASDLAPTLSGVPKRLFVTSNTYVGNVVRTACQESADAAGLGGLWTPWLSARGSFDAIDVIPGNGPWKLLTGEVAFANHTQLSTYPQVPINVTEKGTALTDDIGVWTGTSLDGRASGLDCGAWTDAASLLGTDGDYRVTSDVTRLGNYRWTDGGYQSCDGLAHVFCFEQ
jgi:hypothetical protein